ncbi:MAG: hypothetical protein U0794_21995 [Isosphaeraceae bacterium]
MSPSALWLAALCIAACEYSQLVYVTPSTATFLGLGDPALLAAATARPTLAPIAHPATAGPGSPSGLGLDDHYSPAACV